MCEKENLTKRKDLYFENGGQGKGEKNHAGVTSQARKKRKSSRGVRKKGAGARKLPAARKVSSSRQRSVTTEPSKPATDRQKKAPHSETGVLRGQTREATMTPHAGERSVRSSFQIRGPVVKKPQGREKHEDTKQAKTWPFTSPVGDYRTPESSKQETTRLSKPRKWRGLSISF